MRAEGVGGGLFGAREQRAILPVSGATRASALKLAICSPRFTAGPPSVFGTPDLEEAKILLDALAP